MLAPPAGWVDAHHAGAGRGGEATLALAALAAAGLRPGGECFAPFGALVCRGHVVVLRLMVSLHSGQRMPPTGRSRHREQGLPGISAEGSGEECEGCML